MSTHENQARSSRPALPRRWASIAAGAALVAVISATYASCSASRAQGKEDTADVDAKAPRPSELNPQIVVAAVEPHDVGKTLVTSSRIAFDEGHVAHVWSPVTGRVTKILVNLGDKVRRGQPLAVIVSPDLGNALSDMDKAKPAVIQTEKELKRQQELYAAHAGPLRDLEAAQANYDQAVAELQRATEKAKLLMANAGKANAVVQSFTLTSPIDGEILARQINPGTEVQGQYSGGATVELFTIGKVDADVWAFADVYEQDVARVKRGAPVQFKVVAYPDQVFSGTVDWVSGMLDPATRTVTVRCVLPNTEGLLKPNMYATAEIETEGHKAVAVARSAILHLGDKTVVMLADKTNNKYERMPVIVDEDETGDWVPVLHGLQTGDSVVTQGALLLSGAD